MIINTLGSASLTSIVRVDLGTNAAGQHLAEMTEEAQKDVWFEAMADAAWRLVLRRFAEAGLSVEQAREQLPWLRGLPDVASDRPPLLTGKAWARLMMAADVPLGEWLAAASRRLADTGAATAPAPDLASALTRFYQEASERAISQGD